MINFFANPGEETVNLKNILSKDKSAEAGKSQDIELVVNYFINKFLEVKLEVASIFRFADRKNEKSIKIDDFCTSIKKLIQNVQPEMLEGLKKVFPQEIITMEILETQFPSKKVDQNGLTLEKVYWLQRLTTLLSRSKTQPQAFYASITPVIRGKVTYKDLKDKINEIFILVFKKEECDYLIKSLCENDNTEISQADFLSSLKNSQESNHSNSNLLEYGRYIKNKLAELEIAKIKVATPKIAAKKVIDSSSNIQKKIILNPISKENAEPLPINSPGNLISPKTKLNSILQEDASIKAVIPNTEEKIKLASDLKPRDEKNNAPLVIKPVEEEKKMTYIVPETRQDDKLTDFEWMAILANELLEKFPRNPKYSEVFPDVSLNSLITLPIFANLFKKYCTKPNTIKDAYSSINKRGYNNVFMHEVYTFIDLLLINQKASTNNRKKANLPYKNELGFNRSLTSNLKTFAGYLDSNKIQTYPEQKLLNFNVFQPIDLLQFNGIMLTLGYKDTNNELFNSLIIDEGSTVLIYHFFAVVESYRTAVIVDNMPNPAEIIPQNTKIKETAPADALKKEISQPKPAEKLTIETRSTGKESQVIKNPKKEEFKTVEGIELLSNELLQNFPSNPDYLKLFPGIALNKLLQAPEFDELLRKFNYQTNVIKDTYAIIDGRSYGSIFIYEVYTFLDLLMVNKKMTENNQKAIKFPYKRDPGFNRSLKQNLDTLAIFLDSKKFPTYQESKLTNFNPFTPMDFEKFSAFVLSYGYKGLVDELFNSFKIDNNVTIYHFFAILESYRTNIIVEKIQTNLERAASLPKLKAAEAKPAEVVSKISRNDLNPALGDVKSSESVPKSAINESKQKNIPINNPKDAINEEGKIEKLKVRRLEDLIMPNDPSKIIPDSYDFSIYIIKEFCRKNYNELERNFMDCSDNLSGLLLPGEFTKFIKLIHPKITTEYLSRLFTSIDTKKVKKIDYESFMIYIFDYEFAIPEPKIQNKKIVPMFNENYKISPSDLFTKSNTKCTTILNSQEAAIKRCQELLSASKGHFIDPDFGPEQGKNGDICVYWNGTPPTSSYPDPNELK